VPEWGWAVEFEGAGVCLPALPNDRSISIDCCHPTALDAAAAAPSASHDRDRPKICVCGASCIGRGGAKASWLAWLGRGAGGERKNSRPPAALQQKQKQETKLKTWPTDALLSTRPRPKKGSKLLRVFTIVFGRRLGWAETARSPAAIERHNPCTNHPTILTP
jgi:hypothetical protein